MRHKVLPLINNFKNVFLKCEFFKKNNPDILKILLKNFIVLPLCPFFFAGKQNTINSLWETK